MTQNSPLPAAEIDRDAISHEHVRAEAIMDSIMSGEFDHHLIRMLDVVTRRMSTAEFRHYRDAE